MPNHEDLKVKVDKFHKKKIPYEPYPQTLIQDVLDRLQDENWNEKVLGKKLGINPFLIRNWTKKKGISCEKKLVQVKITQSDNHQLHGSQISIEKPNGIVIHLNNITEAFVFRLLKEI